MSGGLEAVRGTAGYSSGGGFGSPFVGSGGALPLAAQVFRGGFPALPSAADRPAGLSSLQTLSAPLATLPQVRAAVCAHLQQFT